MSDVHEVATAEPGLQTGFVTIKDKRGAVRAPLRLKAAIVYRVSDNDGTQPTYHGHTNDISLDGVSVVVDRNVFTKDEVTVMLALSPERAGVPEKLIVATAKMIYTVYSPKHSAFRIGLAFRQFVGDGRKLLEARLARV